MIHLKFLDENIDINSNLTNTGDIFDYLSSNKNMKKNELLLVFNNIYISPLCTYPLADIGFSPGDTLDIIFNSTKKIYLKILPFNYIIDQEIDMCTNVFSVKKQMADEFFTVPQNIIVKSKNKILSDDILLFIENSNFEIEVEEGYALYYTFYGQFRYICMSNESTLKDLQNTLFMYDRHTNSNKFRSFSSVLPKENHTKTLRELSKDIKLFEFHEQFIADENYRFVIKVIINNDDHRVTLNPTLPYETNIYCLTCYLERIFKIDRNLFTVYEQGNAKIGKNEYIDPSKNSNITFYISGHIHTIINDEIHKLSYLTSIYDIKEKFHFKDHNFGIVINNQFAFSKGSNDYTNLTNFLTNSQTKVKILKSKQSCHEKIYTKVIGTKPSRSNHFLIPDNMTPDQIAVKYLGVNIDSIQILENDMIIYRDPKALIIHFDFIDEKGSPWQYSFPMQNENPRILNLIQALYDYRIIPLTYKNLKYNARFDMKTLKLGTYLSSVRYDNVNKLKITEFRVPERDEEVLLKKLPEGTEIKVKLDQNTTTELIQNQYNLQNYSLYYDYKLLLPSDKPYFCFNQQTNQTNIGQRQSEFLIANKLLPENNFRVSNGSFEIKIPLQSSHYKYLPFYIKTLFNEDDIKFSLRLNENNYELPPDFDAGSLPYNPLIIIEYRYQPSNLILVKHSISRLVPFQYYTSSISQIKDQIMKSLDFYYYSKNAICFSFYDTVLSSDQTFYFYKITPKMPLSIRYSKNSFPIYVSTPNKIYDKEYRFCDNETILDLKNHLKSQFGIKDEIKISLPDGKSISDNTFLHDKIKLQFTTKQVTVKYSANQTEKEYQFDKIDKVSKVNEFFNKSINGSMQPIIYLFTYNDDEKCYEKADPKKKLGEFHNGLFAHKILSSYNFSGYYYHFDRNNIVSEQNTLEWFKKEFIAKNAKTDPEKLVILRNDAQVDESSLMKDLCKGILMEIKFKDSVSDTKKKNIGPKQQKLNAKDFKPKIVRILSDSPKPQKSPKRRNIKLNGDDKNDRKKNKNNDNKIEMIIHQNIDKYEKINSKQNEHIEDTKTNANNNDDENTENNNNNENHYNENSENNNNTVNENNDNENNANENVNDNENNNNNNNVNENNDNENSENNNNNNNNINENNTDNNNNDNENNNNNNNDNENNNNNNNDNENVNDNEKFENNNDSENQLFAITHGHIDIEIEEEEEEEDETTTNGEINCTFQIGKNEPFSLTMKDTDTIEDARIKLSKREGGIDVNCISIVFAGKKLKKNLLIKSLKLRQNDVLQVYICKLQTILIKSAKCFSVHGKKEFEYYSEYEEEDEVDI